MEFHPLSCCLNQRVFHHRIYRHGISYDEILADLSSRTKGEIPFTFVAIENGKCIGTVSLFSNDLKERADLTPWLGSLYVSIDYRNKGVAKQLMDKVIELSLIHI